MDLGEGCEGAEDVFTLADRLYAQHPGVH